MFDYGVLYDILEPYTAFDIIIGGGGLVSDFSKGVIILSPLYSNPVTRSDRNFSNINELKPQYTQESLTKITFQCDIYKINSDNVKYIESHVESEKIKEILKSRVCSEALKKVDSEIYPVFSTTNFLSEFNENKRLVNRAFFTFDIIYKNMLSFDVDVIKNVEIDIKNLGGF